MRFNFKFLIVFIVSSLMITPIFANIYFDTKEEIYCDTLWSESQKNQASRIFKKVKEDNKALKKEISELKRILREHNIYENDYTINLGNKDEDAKVESTVNKTVNKTVDSNVEAPINTTVDSNDFTSQDQNSSPKVSFINYNPTPIIVKK